MKTSGSQVQHEPRDWPCSSLERSIRNPHDEFKCPGEEDSDPACIVFASEPITASRRWQLAILASEQQMAPEGDVNVVDDRGLAMYCPRAAT